MAERAGFELAWLLHHHVLQTCALSHSATSPKILVDVNGIEPLYDPHQGSVLHWTTRPITDTALRRCRYSFHIMVDELVEQGEVASPIFILRR